MKICLLLEVKESLIFVFELVTKEVYKGESPKNFWGLGDKGMPITYDWYVILVNYVGFA
jgi:hypothetical protein